MHIFFLVQNLYTGFALMLTLKLGELLDFFPYSMFYLSFSANTPKVV